MFRETLLGLSKIIESLDTAESSDEMQVLSYSTNTQASLRKGSFE